MSNVSQNETKMPTNKPLNLQYVSQVIGDDWKKWKPGDVVTINAQTGTGKTYFITGAKRVLGLIDYMPKNERLIYLCNRTALKEQVKLDLMDKFNIEPPWEKDDNGEFIVDDKGNRVIDLKKLDDRSVYNNVVVSSYHYIKEKEEQILYLEYGVNNLDDFRYIVADEGHWLLTDSAFCHTNLVYRRLIQEKHDYSTMIYISATIDEIMPHIESCFSENQELSYKESKLHRYDTGIDYSYLNTKYIKNNKDLLQIISNDKTDDKWIIFVTSLEGGKRLRTDISKKGISCQFVHKDNKDNPEVKNIIKNNKFDCKVLISTKFLDNGVNIKDPEVKNIVAMAYDKTTLVQEIGRVRINIKNPPQINLYIKTMSNGAFTKLSNKYQSKLDDVNLFETNLKGFRKKYNTDMENAPKGLFFLDEVNQWVLSITGHIRLIEDNKFAERIIAEFNENKNKFAYIKEQLKWLALDETFDPTNLLVDVPDVEEVISLKEWLDSHLSMRLYDEAQQELSDLIIKELTTIGNRVDYRTKKLKPSTIGSILRDELCLQYAVSKPKKEDKTVDGVRQIRRYITINRLN